MATVNPKSTEDFTSSDEESYELIESSEELKKREEQEFVRILWSHGMMDKSGNGSTIDWNGYRRLSPVLVTKTDEELQQHLISLLKTEYDNSPDNNRLSMLKRYIDLATRCRDNGEFVSWIFEKCETATELMEVATVCQRELNIHIGSILRRLKNFDLDRFITKHRVTTLSRCLDLATRCSDNAELVSWIFETCANSWEVSEVAQRCGPALAPHLYVFLRVLSSKQTQEGGRIVENSFQIFVRLDFRTITLVVYPSDTIAIIKGKIHDKEGFSPKLQRLVYGGSTLQNDRTISSYYIYSESTLFLV